MGRRGGADGRGCEGLEDAPGSSSLVGAIARTDGACASNEPMKVWCAGEFHGDGEDEHSDIAALRPALGETAFTVAWAEGRAMTLERAIEYALADGLANDP